MKLMNEALHVENFHKVFRDLMYQWGKELKCVYVKFFMSVYKLFVHFAFMNGYICICILYFLFGRIGERGSQVEQELKEKKYINHQLTIIYH